MLQQERVENEDLSRGKNRANLISDGEQFIYFFYCLQSPIDARNQPLLHWEQYEKAAEL